MIRAGFAHTPDAGQNKGMGKAGGTQRLQRSHHSVLSDEVGKSVGRYRRENPGRCQCPEVRRGYRRS